MYVFVFLITNINENALSVFSPQEKFYCSNQHPRSIFRKISLEYAISPEDNWGRNNISSILFELCRWQITKLHIKQKKIFPTKVFSIFGQFKIINKSNFQHEKKSCIVGLKKNKHAKHLKISKITDNIYPRNSELIQRNVHSWFEQAYFKPGKFHR